MHTGNHTRWVGIADRTCREPEDDARQPYGATVRRLSISVVVIGLIIGFAGVFTHNDRALILGIVLSLGGIWVAIH